MMDCQPDIGTFKQIYDAGKPQLLWTEMVADLETPVATYLKLANSQPNSFLLESVLSQKLNLFTRKSVIPEMNALLHEYVLSQKLTFFFFARLCII